MKSVFTFLAILFLGSSLLAQDISGNWVWEYANGKHITNITLIETTTDNYEGYYCSVFYEGKKIDCSNNTTEVCINIQKTATNIFVGTFSSPSRNGSGDIKITFLPLNQTFKLEILESEGEFYLSNNSIFKKVK